MAWVLSLLVHAVGLGGSAVLMARLASPVAPAPLAVASVVAPAQEDFFEIDLPSMQAPTALLAPATASSEQAALPDPNGGVAAPHLDQQEHGRGGELTGQPALNLADHDDGILLSKDLLSRLDRSQVQRLRTSEERASLEDRRATWKPMELTFLASGKGLRQERRAAAEHDPSRGERFAAAPSVQGGTPGAQPLPPGEGESPRIPGNAFQGGLRSSPRKGVQDSADGNEQHEGAEVAFARPSVAEGRPAVPAVAVERPRDNADSEQEVASAVQSLLHASPFGGRSGEGRGGEVGPGAPGAGGDRGPGASSRAAGRGTNGSLDVRPADPTIGAYTRLVFGKVNAMWGAAFPKNLAAQGRQGIAIIDFTILADGRVVNVALTRTSGYPEYDEIVRQAVLRSAPFPPMPAAFGAAKAWRISFDAKNPAVR